MADLRQLFILILLAAGAANLAAQSTAQPAPQSTAQPAPQSTTQSVAQPVAQQPYLLTGSTNTSQLVKVARKMEGGKGQITVERTYITVGMDKFGFLSPEGFRVEVSQDDRVDFVKPDLTAQLKLTAHNPLPEGRQPDVAECRRLLLEMYPEAQIELEYGRPALGQMRITFDFTFSPSEKVKRFGRAVFIPFNGGILIISLETEPGREQDNSGPFYTLLRTLQASDENGKLEMRPISNQL